MTLQQLQTSTGKYTISAFDQRSSLVKMLKLDPHDPQTHKRLVELKNVFMETFSPISSAVLVDPDFGLPSLEKKAKNSGLLLTLESFDYAAQSSIGIKLKEGWGVKEIAGYNAAVKLYFPYNPTSEQAQDQRETIAHIFNETKNADVPFLLEPILYPIDEKEFPSVFYTLHKQMVKDFSSLCDILKLEFPAHPDEVLTDEVYKDRCLEVTSLSTVPWVVLSKGMDYDKYLKFLKIAMQNGAKGMAVGRAVWKEISNLTTDEQRYAFIQTTGKERMQRLIDVVMQ